MNLTCYVDASTGVAGVGESRKSRFVEAYSPEEPRQMGRVGSKVADRSVEREVLRKERARRLPEAHQTKSDSAQSGREAERESALPVALLRAREAVMVHMRPVLRAHGFTEQQWRVLRKLDRSVPIDKTTLSSRATLLMPSLLRILKDLEEMALVRLVSSDRNPRLSRVILSAKGAAAVARTTADIEAAGKAVRDQIGNEAVRELLELLQIVERRLTGFALA